MKIKSTKKHYKQFTQSEKNLLRLLQENAKVKSLTQHASKRIKERDVFSFFTEADIYKAIESGKVIEVKKIHKKKSELRVLFRGDTAKYGYNIVVSYSVTNREIVSVWLNHVSDTHEGATMGKYDDSMDIIKELSKINWFYLNHMKE